jgi:glycosyltransferase involved in cell wall biosynthesis
MYAFAKWVYRTDKPDTVKIHYHGSLQDDGWDIMDLKRDLKLDNRLIITAPNLSPKEGLPIELMPYVYGVANVGLSTTLGEGWGLTTHERMAMGIPMIVPNFSALGEWPNGGVHYTTIIEEPYYNIHQLNTRGGVSSVSSIIQALELMYTNTEYRNDIAEKGYKLATQAKYNWRTIAEQFNTIFKQVVLETVDDGNVTGT